MALTKAHNRMIASAPVSVKDFGAVGDGVTNDTVAIQAAINSLSDGGTLLFDGGTFKFATVIFDVKYGNIKGDGIIKGTIRVRAPDYLTNANLRRVFFVIDGLTFLSGSFNAVDRGIELIDVRKGVITNCKFEGLKSCIYTPVNEDTNWGQVSTQIVITNNQYNDCNYFVVGESSRPSIDYGMSDTVISHNSGVAKIDHISLNTYDGVTISDNIFFADLSSAQSRNCVRLTNGAWAQIHDNKFFEMGEEQVRIESVTHGSIHNNVYAWSGRRVEKPALLVTGTPEGGNYFTFLNIHDEEIHRPSGVGISIGAKQGRMNIHHNLIYLPGNNDRYTGTPPLSGDTRGIVLDADLQFINTSNNSTYGGTYTLTDGTALVLNRHDANMNEVSNVVYRTTVPVVLTLAGTETSVDVAKADIGQLSQSSATNFSALISSTEIKTITFRAFNGNTTFVHGATLGLKGGINATLSSGNTITFLCYSDQAHEVARNF